MIQNIDMDFVQAASGENPMRDAVPRESQCLSCLAFLGTWIPTDGIPPICQEWKCQPPVLRRPEAWPVAHY